jgi:hypothetical protein
MTESGRIKAAYVAVTLWLVIGLTAGGQTPQGSTGTTTDQKASAPKQQLTPAEQRRADLLADTEKLYQLTQELKAEVAKSNKDTLSVSVVKKAQEVERLAKSIKERSKTQ